MASDYYQQIALRPEKAIAEGLELLGEIADSLKMLVTALENLENAVRR